jgi:tetratricopeptide (TPR) repeat protein
MVKTDTPLSFYLRILFVSLFVALLGLAPVPYMAARDFLKASRAMAGGELQNTATSLAEIASYFPWRSNLNISAAQFAFKAGDPQSTIRYLERPGTISKLTTADLILLGEAYEQSGNTPMAAAIWKHVLELSDSVTATQRLADLYLQQKDYSNAASYLQKLLLINPSRVQLYYQIGVLNAITDPGMALPYLSQAAEMDSTDAVKAKTLHDKIRTANLFDEPAYTALIVGRQLADWGDWELAKAAFQRAISLRPDYADAWAFLSEAMQQVARQETGAVSEVGLPQLELAIQLDRNSIPANTLMGLYWERLGDYSQAEQYLQHAISINSKDPYLYSELGNIFSKAGDLPAAQSAYEYAIYLTPQDPLFYRQLAQFALDNQIQIRELALPAARQAIILDQTNASSLDVMAQVMLMLVDYPSAERFSIQAIQADPAYAPAYLHLGTAYLYQGEVVLAQVWLGQAKLVDPNSWVASQASRMLDYYFPK